MAKSKETVIDRILNFIFLRFIPSWIVPNHITILRFIGIPILVFLLMKGYTVSSLALFIFLVFSGVIDGALARSRKQVTDWRIVSDQVLGNILFGLVVAFLVTKYIHPILALALVTLEIILFLKSIYKMGIATNSKIWRMKVFLGYLAIIILFAFVLSGSIIYLHIATGVLFVVALLATLSLFFVRKHDS